MDSLAYTKVLDDSHPVKIYIEENFYLKKLLAEFSKMESLNDIQLAYNIFNQVALVDTRYTRKENQLFPYLEKRGWTGPSQGMWTFHDANRKLIKDLRAQFETKRYDHIIDNIHYLISELSRMILIEETRLFPNALSLLTHEDWEEMKSGESEIGWMHKKNKANPHEISETASIPNSISDGFVKLSEGLMNVEQINLMLQFIPFDLTFVDENDRVLFYNRGEERVFPRSAGVIGREVRFCHPPKSVDTVLKILEEFKSGRKSVADFWINFKGKVIHIRYYAIRDHLKNYKGVIEVSQDITDIQKLTGEKRLLDWEN